jgi:hypothetical protein
VAGTEAGLKQSRHFSGLLRSCSASHRLQSQSLATTRFSLGSVYNSFSQAKMEKIESKMTKILRRIAGYLTKIFVFFGRFAPFAA